ncbi:MAG: PAS domain S-box protein [Syntrophaceae bacterium]
MNDQKKTKNQLIDELTALRKQVAEADRFEQSRPSTMDEVPNPTVFYKHLLENIDEGILVTDKDDKIIFVNDPMVEIAGVPQEQILGIAILRDFSEDTLRYFRPHYLIAKETLNTISFDSIEVVTPAARMTYQSGTLVPIIKDGHFDGMICTIHDITELKRVEEALRERVKELNCLYSIADIIEKTYTTDEIFRKTADLMPNSWYYPEVACARITYGDQEFKTDNFQETAWKISADMVVHDKQIGTVEVFYLEEMPDRDEGSFLKEERKLINAMAESLERVIERKQAEEALRTSEQKYRLVLENANEAIFIAQDGMLKYINPATIKLIDYTEEVILSKPFTEFIHPEDHSMVLERHLNRLKSEEVPEVYSFRVITSNRAVKWVQVHATQIEWEGRPATINFLIDITIRKKAEEDREKLILELREALSKIKTLSGLLPICSSCKKIRDDKGYWNQIESYISQHSEAEFSHSICPECAKNLYPDLYKKMYPEYDK